MAERKRKWGDRKDGIWLKDIPAMNRIMPPLMPNRADNEAYINIDIDTRPLNAYLEKLNEGRTEDKFTPSSVTAVSQCLLTTLPTTP